jgi:hypothetical protein
MSKGDPTTGTLKEYGEGHVLWMVMVPEALKISSPFPGSAMFPMKLVPYTLTVVPLP